MKYIRLIVDLWILLPISTEARTLFDKMQQAMSDMGKLVVTINKDEKNQENTTVVDYKNVSDKDKNHLNITADYAFLMPMSTEAMELFEATRLIFRDLVKHVEPPDVISPGPGVGKAPIRMKYHYHICKHRPPHPRFDVRQSEPCEPEVKYEMRIGRIYP